MRAYPESNFDMPTMWKAAVFEQAVQVGNVQPGHRDLLEPA